MNWLFLIGNPFEKHYDFHDFALSFQQKAMNFILSTLRFFIQIGVIAICAKFALTKEISFLGIAAGFIAIFFSLCLLGHGIMLVYNEHRRP